MLSLIVPSFLPSFALSYSSFVASTPQSCAIKKMNTGPADKSDMIVYSSVEST